MKEQIDFLIKKLKRKNGTLNTRYIDSEEFRLLRENNLITPQNIYDYENNTSEICNGFKGIRSDSCLGVRRFINYKKGYKANCKPCGNWRNREKVKDKRFDKTNPVHIKERYNIDLENIQFEDILNYLKNKKGSIEGQRLNKKHFESRGLIKAWDYLESIDCTSTEKIWVYLNGEPKCNIEGCQNKPRFSGFGEGYKEYCIEHSSTNRMLQMQETGTIKVNLDELHDFLLDANGGYSSQKIRMLHPETINNLVNHTNFLKDDASISERLYNYRNNYTEPRKCKYCGEDNFNFHSANGKLAGYKAGCSPECNYNLVDYEARKMLGREKWFEKLLDKLENLDNLDLDGNHEIIEKPCYNQYLIDRNPCIKIRHHCKDGKTFEYTEDIQSQGSLKCPNCFPRRSKQQIEIYDMLKCHTDDILFNDRVTIKPKELDIYLPGLNIAIEYDGIEFHSFGKHTYRPFNNYNEEKYRKNEHLQKTKECLDKGIRLFHVFSNEYLSNPEIWNSVLLNAMGVSKRIFARKCVVKEIDCEYKDFLIENHLQGYVRASIKLGLFYDDELVSVMSFGKSRYNKNYEYELLRFCSKLNTTVVGGASKLLKYFELNYNPKSIISYANRRWSVGNLYNVLGFKEINESAPNYFYFKVGDLELQSRVKYQKHKLKNLLENFDESLTETENMYNNGYRKIYDCGNLVFAKIY